MKKLTLIACAMPALMLLNGCGSGSDIGSGYPDNNSYPYRLCLVPSSPQASYCKAEQWECSTGDIDYDVYSTAAECRENLNNYLDNTNYTWNLCTRTTQTELYTSCTIDDTCKEGYSYNSNWSSRDICSDAADTWLYDNS